MALAVEGYRELLLATAATERRVPKEIRDALRNVGEGVRKDAARLFEQYDERTAEGYRVRVRQRGIDVEQSLRKTTGKRPDYGALQMRKALIPAADKAEGEDIEKRMGEAVDEIADYFDLVHRWRGAGLL